MTVDPQRSGLASENLQEYLDADASKGFAFGKAEQYFTPYALVQYCQSKQSSLYPSTILDPQCGEGDLLKHLGAIGCYKFGIEMDNRIGSIDDVNLITGNCVKVFEIIEDLFPNLRFACINANPPFGRKWRLKDGRVVDSTWYTWQQATTRGMYGYFIANAKTIEELGIDKHPFVYRYECKAGSDFWRGMHAELKIGIVWWKNPLAGTVWRDVNEPTLKGEVLTAWKKVEEVIEQERVDRPDFNIYLDDRGYLRTYLSIRNQFKLKLPKETVERLHTINDCHPLTLTTEKETRDLMFNLVTCGMYTVQPEARQAIEDALKQVNSLACPIMPVTNFETVAYADEEETLTCITEAEGLFNLTQGLKYRIKTGSYKFTESFTRQKIHCNERTGTMYKATHNCELSGQDRYIELVDDTGAKIQFMDRPIKGLPNCFEESLLWKHFKKPVVQTVAEVYPEIVEKNKAIMRAIEMVAGFTYFGGQFEYLSRWVRDYGLVAGQTGTGKTLMALTLITMKAPNRTLLIAPQGTMRTSESQDREDATEFDASQWLREIQKFAPHLQVFQLFSYEDYQRIIDKHGELPSGVYVSYPQAMFSNGAFEGAPDSWDDERLNKWAKQHGFAEMPKPRNAAMIPPHELARWNCRSIGREVKGIRCIVRPCLATIIGRFFDAVFLDEAHICCNLDARITQMLIRLQPKFRFAFTATPIPNIVSNLFSLLGWLAVPGWFKGGVRNAAFPYAREEEARFNSTFLSMERDFTQEEMNKAAAERAGTTWSGKCQKPSPVISSPARLLKLIKPTMAFISKRQCRPDYIEPRIIDVRVPMGLEQAELYKYFLNRNNIVANDARVRAAMQVTYLRAICTDPKGFSHGGPKVRSNMNPKVLAILELVRDILGRREQVVIINSRVGLTDTIQEKLQDAGVGICRIDSTTGADMQSHQSNLFKARKAPVMLLGMKCASAHSFDDAENAIIGSLEFSNGPFTQACGRIDRLTNLLIKNIYTMLHRFSYEETMFDLVATKDDAATICLRGERVPRNFKPVDGQEVLAAAIERFDLSGATPEIICEKNWPELRDKILKARNC